ncbi:MAG: tetratricopeptide repeat protein [Actinomycetota bacterium]|nr:tetratricopeptide repeat protein [Actinomycetota bacterium]
MRQLRVARGLTQEQLAGTRFTKQYMSGIERGTTRPTADTLVWLAERLGVDAHFLEVGFSSGEWERAHSLITRAEAAVEGDDYASGLALLGEAATVRDLRSAPELHLRALVTEGWARMSLGELDHALAVLRGAHELADEPAFADIDRADVLFRLGCCRYKLSSISTALALFDDALTLADRSGFPCDRLRSQILSWRSRCYRRQRDWEAAHEDVERALELAESLGDARAVADAHFQGSIIAERQGRWVLARSYAERAKLLYEEIDDGTKVARLLNNLGGLAFLLGKPEEAVASLKRAFSLALDAGNDADAAQAVSSLAQVHLRTDRPELAEAQARQALELLAGRVDYLDEIGNAELVLGRALAEQDRVEEAEVHFAASEDAFARASLTSHRAAAWAAQADLAVRRGDKDSAVALYRRAVESLQDFHF